MTPKDKLESLRAKLAEHATLTRKLSDEVTRFAGELARLKQENLRLKQENARLRWQVHNLEKPAAHWLDTPVEEHSGSCDCPDCFHGRNMY